MVEKLRQDIVLPGWLAGIIVTILIAAFTYSVSTSGRITRIEEKALKSEQLIEKKANQSDLDRVYSTLDRIEAKIDNLQNKINN